jgi:virulence-associated protein VapD
MANTILEKPRSLGTIPSPIAQSLPKPVGKAAMYAIAFELDTDTLKMAYGSDSYNNAYGDIRRILTGKHHFNWQQGSVYFGDPARVNAVSCVLAIMDVSRTFAWFAPSVKDIRMLRIEEQNDLMDAVQQAAAH